MMGPDRARVLEGVEIVLVSLGSLMVGEKVCIVTDDRTHTVGDLFRQRAEDEGAQPFHHNIEPLVMHGQEPPREVARCMKDSDLIIGLTTRSMAHTRARKESSERGARYLSLPEYSMELLAHSALRVDFRRSAAAADVLASRFTRAGRIRIRTEAGTDITLHADGRTGNFCPGYVTAQHLLGSPPDIESNIAPLEDSSEGVVVVDGSIPCAGLGKLTSPISLRIEEGMISSIEGDPAIVRRLEELFGFYGEKARVLAEFGVGFNEGAKVCGNMLLDEGAYGTFHLGFGSNHTIGGANDVGFHLDCVFYGGTIQLDGETIAL